MAEVAAGALATEQAISTTIEGGAVAAVAIAQPTEPLRASFERIGSAPSSDSPDSLARSHHSVTNINNNLYIYGGIVGSSKLAGPEVHILNLSPDSQPLSPGAGHTSYKTVPPLFAAGQDGPVPSARSGHTAVSLPDGQNRGVIALFGGSTDAEHNAPLDEQGRVWLFDSETLHWKHLDPAADSTERPSARSLHSAASAPGSSLIIHGGKDAAGASLTDTWRFDRVHQVWSRLPSLPIPEPDSKDQAPFASSSPPALAVVHGHLYALTAEPHSLSMALYSLDLNAATRIQEQESDAPTDFSSAAWNVYSIPTNPLTPSPSLKFSGAAFLPISTGLGRTYLLHMMGAQISHPSSSSSNQSHEPTYSSTIHALQLPSHASPAAAKDAARDIVPRANSHRLEWHAVEVVAKEEGPTKPTWLDTLEEQQQNVRSTVTSAANAAGEWIKGRARAVSSAARDLHVAGAEEPEEPATKPSVTKENQTAGVVMEDKETAAATSGMTDLSLESTPPKAGGTSTKDDLPLSSQIPHRIAPGADGNDMQGNVSGKAHPGPRAWFGCSSLGEPKVGTVGSGEKPTRVVMWGGVNAKGEIEGDGWVVTLRV
ncbi:MAG: hypothetical protein Q9159_005449 [Coniocarpon cinnabarinum]